MKIFTKKNTGIVTQIIIFFVLISLSPVFADDIATVIASQGLVRNTADFGGTPIGTLPIGTQVLVQDRDNDWYQVMLQDTSLKGWMYKDIVVKNDENSGIRRKALVAVDTVLNLRSLPSTDSTILTRLSNGHELEIINTMGEWLEVQLVDGTRGFVYSNYINTKPDYPQAKTLRENTVLYKKANTQADVVIKLDKNKDVYIKGYQNGWFNVLTIDFIEGWIKCEEVELTINITQPVTRSGSRTSTLASMKEYTQKYLGKPYRYATAGPNSFDCSGFTYYIFNTYYKDYLKQNGINLPRSSRDQAKVGTPIARNQLQLGDLVFFNNGSSSTISHVGIYLGDNQFIHASSGINMKVVISPLDTGTYNKRYSTAVRL